MRLYQYAFSPACQKVIAVAHEVGTPLEIVDVEVFQGGARTPEMLAKNANGKVPVLQDGDFVLWESSAIAVYIAGKAGRSDLAPTTLRERADVDRWIVWETAHFGAAVRRVAFERVVKQLAGLGAPDEAAIKTGTELFATCAAALDRELGSKAYLCGQLTVADFAVAPYAALATDCGLDYAPYPRVRAWLDRMLARDSMQKTLRAAKAKAA